MTFREKIGADFEVNGDYFSYDNANGIFCYDKDDECFYFWGSQDTLPGKGSVMNRVANYLQKEFGRRIF